MRLKPGTIIWHDFPFTNLPEGSKERPSLVLDSSFNMVELVEVTSWDDETNSTGSVIDINYNLKRKKTKKKENALWFGDVIIDNWKDIDKLSIPSVIRPQTIIQAHTTSLNKSDIGGTVSEETLSEVWRYIKAIEDMYFDIPYFFAQWCVRYQPKYLDYLNIHRNCKSIRELQEGEPMNSLDISIFTIEMCLNLGLECCLSAFLWEKGNRKKYHIFPIWRENARYMRIDERNEFRYFSTHCFYNDRTRVMADFWSKSFKEATNSASNEYCNLEGHKYTNRGHYYFITSKYELEWAVRESRNITQEKLIRKIFGSTPQIDASFEP